MIELTNPVDAASFSRDLVQVEPSVPGLRVSQYDNVLELNGETAGHTTATLAVSTPTFVEGSPVGDRITLAMRVSLR